MSSRSSLPETSAKSFDRDFIPERPSTIWALEPHVLELINREIHTSALNQELSKIVADPAYDGGWPLGRLTLHRGNGFSLCLRMLADESPYIRTVPHYGLLVSLGQSPLQYDVFKLPETYNNQLFDPNIKLEHIGSRELGPGKALKISPDGEIPHFRLQRPHLVFDLSTAPTQYLQWLFNRESLLAWQANDSAMSFSQLRVAAHILGKFAHQTSLEPLGQLARHPYHAVRWTAIQGLGRISRSAALERLQVAVDDPHPHVRRAATKTLQQLQQAKR